MHRQIAPLFSLLTLLAPVAAHAQGVTVRIMPPPRAQFLQFQKFDVRVEAAAVDAAAAVTSIKVMLDGRDITASGVTDSPSASVRNWTLRNMQLGLYGDRAITATATGASGTNTISGSTESRITVRRWTGPAPS